MTPPLTDVWSGYSLLRSLWKIPDLVQELGKRGFNQALLADWDSLAGTEEFDRLMRQTGLSPLVGVTRMWLFNGVPHEVRLVAQDAEAWSWIAEMPETGEGRPPGAVMVLGASENGWWAGAEPILGDSVVLELKASQESLLSELPPSWHWVPACRVRYAAPHDGDAYKLLTQIGGLAPDSTAEALPETPAHWFEPFSRWSQDRLWQPASHDTVFTRHVWKMPHVPGIDDEVRHVREAAATGLTRRFDQPVPPAAAARLEYELGVIEDLGFCGYFIMVADVVNWAKREGIRVGPGRGSAAGSLVSYALGITDVDPLQYDLVFERFLNPARHTLPDIDLDFEDTRRGEVIAYLRQRHGLHQVAQIGTYGTLGARAVLRDVARVQGLASDRVSAVLKRVEWGIGDTLGQHADALKQACRELAMPIDWIDAGLRLEGLPRHRSTHAAGVIISPHSLVGHLYCHGQSDEGWITDFDMASVEQLGYVKLDVLGLRTLSTLSRLEAQLGYAPDFVAKVDGYDGETLNLLGRGDTDGIFQLDSRGVKTLLRQMRPRSREEIMLVVALYRPGPMDAIGELLRRRAARYRPAPDDPLESLLGETYGIMVYQEQLMAAVQEVAGFTLAEADLVRRAISKKDHAKLAQAGQQIMANMKAKGYSADVAAGFWDRIRAFGDYGFNKSHAASYGLISYYFAYVKAHHPLQFWAAELSSHENGDRLRELMIQAVSQGITIHPPHVNRSSVSFEVQDGALLAGLGMIRGVGGDTAAKIVEARHQNGPYGNLEDFSRRIGRVPQTHLLETLEGAGALKGLGAVSGLASAQMSLFDAPADAAEPDTNWLEAFGFHWPEADGPIYIRMDSGQELEPLMKRIRAVAAQVPGSVPLAVIVQPGKAHPLPQAAVSGDWRAINLLKQVEGVQAAGRHVTV